MTKQTIDNLQPGTLDGDSLFRTAEKINENFNEIYSHFGDGQNLDDGYAGLKGLNAGLITSAGAGAYNVRELVAGSTAISITNGTGSGGNPTIDLPDTGVLSAGSSATAFADVGLTVDVKGRIVSITTPTFLASAQAAASTATSSATTIANSLADANKLAINAEDAQYTLSDGTTTGFSALHHAAKAAADVATIGTSLSDANQAKIDAQTAASTATQKASDASTSEGNASNSASAASTSEGNASTSETNAGNAQTAAETARDTAVNAVNSIGTAVSDAQAAASAAATSYDSFDDRYLGEKSSAPTTDNDGNTLVTGALYFNSTSDKMFVRTSGGSWTAAGSAVNGTTNRQSYIATAGQTSFSATYDVGYIDVYLNGIKLSSSDFTASNGSSFVLGSGASAGDQVDSIAYGAFSVANHYTKTEADTLLAAKATTVDLATTNTAVGTKAPLATPTFTGGVVNVENSGSAASALRLFCESNNAHYLALNAPPHAQFSGNVELTLPPNTGTSGQFLQTDGNGVMSWGTVSVPAGGNSVELTATGGIAQGAQVVLNSDGTTSSVAGTIGGGVGMSNVFEQTASNTYSYDACYDTVNNQYFFLYCRDNAVKCVFATLSGTTFTYGSEIAIYTGGNQSFTTGTGSAQDIGNSNSQFRCAYDEAQSKVIVIYTLSNSYGYVTVVTPASGRTGTPSTSPTLIDTNINYPSVCHGGGRNWIHYTNNNQGGGWSGFYKATISGSGTSATVATTNGDWVNTAVTYYCDVAFDPHNNAVLFTYVDQGNSFRLTGRAAHYNSSTTNLELGNEFSISAGGVGANFDTVFDATQNKLVVLYQQANNYPTSRNLTKSGTGTGTSFNMGAVTYITTAQTIDYMRGVYRADTGKVVAIYRQSGTLYGTQSTGIFAEGTSTSGSSSVVTWGSAFQEWTGGSSFYYAPVYDPDEQEVISFLRRYATSGSWSYAGAAAILRPTTTNLTTSNWLGVASSAAASGQQATILLTGAVSAHQSGLTLNTEYYVDADGTLSTTNNAYQTKVGLALGTTKLKVA